MAIDGLLYTARLREELFAEDERPEGFQIHDAGDLVTGNWLACDGNRTLTERIGDIRSEYGEMMAKAKLKYKPSNKMSYQEHEDCRREIQDDLRYFRRCRDEEIQNARDAARSLKS